eukprot:4801419-Prymnesium_polylepis.1
MGPGSVAHWLPLLETGRPRRGRFLAHSSEDRRFRRGSERPVGRRQSRQARCPSVSLFVCGLVCIAVRDSLLDTTPPPSVPALPPSAGDHGEQQQRHADGDRFDRAVLAGGVRGGGVDGLWMHCATPID